MKKTKKRSYAFLFMCMMPAGILSCSKSDEGAGDVPELERGEEVLGSVEETYPLSEMLEKASPPAKMPETSARSVHASDQAEWESTWEWLEDEPPFYDISLGALWQWNQADEQWIARASVAVYRHEDVPYPVVGIFDTMTDGKYAWARVAKCANMAGTGICNSSDKEDWTRTNTVMAPPSSSEYEYIPVQPGTPIRIQLCASKKHSRNEMEKCSRLFYRDHTEVVIPHEADAG